MNSTRLLVLFDIDGTLLISHGIGRKAIRHALLEVFGIEGALDSQKVGGRSYREIVAGALGGTGITADQISSRWEPFNRAVEQAMREPINQKPGLITALPGGLRLIEVLSSDSCVITGLLTGNPPGVSRLKLESAGYSMQSFQVAVFGDDAETPRRWWPWLSSRRWNDMDRTALDAERYWSGTPSTTSNPSSR